MDFSFIEIVLLVTCSILSIAALQAIFRSRHTTMDPDHHAFIQSMIRQELAKIKADEKHDQLLNDIQRKVFPDDLFSE